MTTAPLTLMWSSLSKEKGRRVGTSGCDGGNVLDSLAIALCQMLLSCSRDSEDERRCKAQSIMVNGQRIWGENHQWNNDEWMWSGWQVLPTLVVLTTACGTSHMCNKPKTWMLLPYCYYNITKKNGIGFIFSLLELQIWWVLDKYLYEYPQCLIWYSDLWVCVLMSFPMDLPVKIHGLPRLMQCLTLNVLQDGIVVQSPHCHST